MQSTKSNKTNAAKKEKNDEKNQNYLKPFFLEYSILAEVNILQTKKLLGVYVIPSSKSPLVWFGVMFVRQGMYQGGIFRFKLLLPDDYPSDQCPRLIFDDFVFHPIVSPSTYEMDVKRGFNCWKKKVHHIWHVLFYARKAFYKFDTSNPLNKEAANLYNSDREQYSYRAQTCVAHWKMNVYEVDEEDSLDPHYIKFSPYNQDLHLPIRQSWKKPVADNQAEAKDRQDKGGMSFIKPGTLKIFSQTSS